MNQDSLPLGAPAPSGAKPLALISGGSSGIGLEAAKALLRRGWRVVLVARDAQRLSEAAADCTPREDVLTEALDVTDSEAAAALVDRLEATLGPIALLIANAGMAEPGHFLEQPLALHKRHMAVNYFGALHLVHPLTPRMAARKAGRILLVSSGAAFVGIYGYGAYAPSKFALRGLGEVLQTELKQHGISVSVAFPPDTDTPQYRAECATRPTATNRISEGGGLWSAAEIGERLVRGVLAGKPVIAPGLGLTALRWVHSFYAPVFIRIQQRVAALCAKAGE